MWAGILYSDIHLRAPNIPIAGPLTLTHMLAIMASRSWPCPLKRMPCHDIGYFVDPCEPFRFRLNSKAFMNLLPLLKASYAEQLPPAKIPTSGRFAMMNLQDMAVLIWALKPSGHRPDLGFYEKFNKH